MYNYKIILRAIDLYNKYKSKKRVSKILKVSRSTIIKWIKKYNNNLVSLTTIINKTHKPTEIKITIKKNKTIY